MTLPEARGVPYRICMVCLGNICRSPMAAAVLTSRLADDGLHGLVVVGSAGTGSWHVGQEADPRAKAALRRRGYDGAAHRARQFDRSWFGDLDLVLALDGDNVAALRRLAPDPESRSRVRLLRSFAADRDPRADSDVPDPYYGTEADFDDSLAIIERSVDGLLSLMRRELVAA
jgi:protein-tyrosine phosphatase